MGPTQVRLELFLSKAAGWVKMSKPAKVNTENMAEQFPDTILWLYDVYTLKTPPLEDSWVAAVGLRLLVMQADDDDLLPLISIIFCSSSSEPSLILVLFIILLCLPESP